MKLLQLVQKMHRKYAGDTKYPSFGGDDWIMYVDIANDLVLTAATDPDHKWSWAFQERTFGTTESGTLAYDLDADVNELSDEVYIDTVDGRTVTFKVIKEKDRHHTHQKAFLSGANPRILNFTDIPAAAIGGTVRAGIYYVPKTMKGQNDIVPVDRPMWVVLAGAAELAFNDPSKEDKFPDLLGLANDEYQKMGDAADSLPQNQLNAVPMVGFEEIGGDC